jgi:hypothetical protein
MGKRRLPQKLRRQLGHGADQIDTTDTVATIAL